MFPFGVFKVVKSIHIPFPIISLYFVSIAELKFPWSEI